MAEIDNLDMNLLSVIGDLHVKTEINRNFDNINAGLLKSRQDTVEGSGMATALAAYRSCRVPHEKAITYAADLTFRNLVTINVSMVGTVGSDIMSGTVAAGLKQNYITGANVVVPMKRTDTHTYLDGKLWKLGETEKVASSSDFDKKHFTHSRTLGGGSTPNMVIISTHLRDRSFFTILRIARDSGTQVCMNTVPQYHLDKAWYGHIKYLIVNYEEAERFALWQLEMGPVNKSISSTLQRLKHLGARNVVITHGHHGASFITDVWEEGKFTFKGNQADNEYTETER